MGNVKTAQSKTPVTIPRTKFKPNFTRPWFWSPREYRLQLWASAAYLWLLRTQFSAGLSSPPSPPFPAGHRSVGWNGSAVPQRASPRDRRRGRQVVRDPPTRGWAPTADRAAAAPRYEAMCQKATSIRYRTRCLRLRVVINRVTRVNCTCSCLWSRAKAYLPKHTSFLFGWLVYSLSRSSLRMSAVETK